MLDLGQNNTIEEIENLLKENDLDPLLHVKLGNLKAEAGKFQDAVNCFKKSLDINENYNPALFCMGNILIEMNRFAEAKDSLEKLLENSPEEFDKADIEFSLGICYMELDENEKAINAFKRVMKIDSEDLFSHVKISEIYRKTGKYREAIEECNKALKKKKEFASAYYELGLAFFSLNEIEEARKQYIVLTKLNPKLAVDLKKIINLV